MQKYYNELEQFIIYLDYIGVPAKKIIFLTQNAKNVSEIKALCVSDEKIKKLLGKHLDYILNKTLDINLVKVVEFLNNKNIYATTFLSEDFPSSLLEVEPQPAILYYKGDLSILGSKLLLGVVGTRKPTRYGRNVTEKFCTSFAENGIITVSGLAYGIDSEVARASIKCKAKTVAVLGGGLGSIYPATNAMLANEIVVNGGLVISEYFPTVKPTKYSFPERNRIISGLAGGVLVIEAGLKSGSLITAMHAIEQGKELFVVPGNIDSKESEGSNKLIEEIPHAFTSSPDSILLHFGVTKKENNVNSYQYSVEELRVLDAIGSEEKTFDELCEILKEDSKTLNLLLTEMEISGIIKKLPGNYYGT